MTSRKTQIVIVGGGAGGLELARKLGAKFGRKRHDIILVERNRTHIWKPLLHEVAAGSLDANLDEVGYRSHCHRWGYRFFRGTLEGLDRDRREVQIAPLLDDDGTELIGPPHDPLRLSRHRDRLGDQRLRHTGRRRELPVPRRSRAGGPLPQQAAQSLPARVAPDECGAGNPTSM